ncbi:MAG: hypothetical protein J0L56_05285 [Chitinophagales bacterium]|nr:hypothetical protein [Chitinophagales bacterium]
MQQSLSITWCLTPVTSIKKLLTVILCLLFVVSGAQPHYTINWSSAPVNPVAFGYTLNQVNLKGKVKKLTDISSWGDTITSKYDAAGLLQSYATNNTDNISSVTTYKYNFPAGLLTAVWSDGGGKSVYHYKFNKQKQLIEAGLAIDNKISNPVKYSYDPEGRLITDSDFSKTYSYNKEGQLVSKEERGLFGKKVFTTYGYKKEDDNLVIISNVKTVDGNYTYNNTITETYNSQGYLVNWSDKTEKKVYYYTFDKTGNWISRTEVIFSNNKQVSSNETKRLIEYY